MPISNQDATRISLLFVPRAIMSEVILGRLRITGLPDDALILNFNLLFERDGFMVEIWSHSFDTVAMGEGRCMIDCGFETVISMRSEK